MSSNLFEQKRDRNNKGKKLDSYQNSRIHYYLYLIIDQLKVKTGRIKRFVVQKIEDMLRAINTNSEIESNFSFYNNLIASDICLKCETVMK